MVINQIDVITVHCPVDGCDGIIVTSIEELSTKGSLECTNGHEILLTSNKSTSH